MADQAQDPLVMDDQAYPSWFLHWPLQNSRLIKKNDADPLKEEQKAVVYFCSSGAYTKAATSFLDGVVNIGLIGKNRFFQCPKILLDTGTLVRIVILSNITISLFRSERETPYDKLVNLEFQRTSKGVL